MSNIFIEASRTKLRFHSNKGWLTVEDLWDLPLLSKNLMNLDTVGKEVRREFNNTEEESMVSGTKGPTNTVYQLRLDVIKHVIAVKLQEKTDMIVTLEVQQQKLKLQEIIARKKDSVLEAMSLEELEAIYKS